MQSPTTVDPNTSTPPAHDELSTITLGPAQLRATGRWSPPKAACNKSAANVMRSSFRREEGSSLQSLDLLGSSSAQQTSRCSMSSLERESSSTPGPVRPLEGYEAPSAEQQPGLDQSQWHSSGSRISSSGSAGQHSETCSQHKELPRRHNPHFLYSRAISQSFLAVVLCALLLGTPIQAARTIEANAPAPQVMPSRQGYEYAGRVQFVQQQKGGVPVLQLGEFSAEAERQDVTHHTVMVTRSGHAYTKRLVTDVTDPQLAGALAATDFRAQRGQIGQVEQGKGLPVQARRLAQTAQPQLGVSNVSTDISCDGCSGTDTRTEITNTLQFPFSAVGELTGQLGTSNRGLECTGTLIGPKHVVTAAHCVFDINDSRQYVSSLNFAPGETSQNNLPFGTAQWSSVRVLSQFTSQPSYTPTAMNYDFALVTLKNAASASAGYMGMTVGQGVVTMNLTTAGYPGEKPPGTQWESLCANVKINYGGNQAPFNEVDQCQSQACANIIGHTCISSNGQSGSSMWDAQNRIRAILTGKVSTSDGQDINVATKVDAFVYNTLAQWYNEDQAAAGSNQTLPAAPSGQQPPPASTSTATFLGVPADWTNPAFVAIVVGLCAAGLLLLVGLGFLVSKACCGGSSRPKAAYGSDVPARRQRQQQTQYAGNGSGAYPNGGYPSHYAGSQRAAQGVAYDERTGQFVVNGRPYGAYR